jgi:sialic acid synthase SpsE
MVMNLLGKQVDDKSPPFIIAEISGSHYGFERRAIELIAEAKRAGADAVKIQIYEPDDMAIPSATMVENEAWQGRDLYSLYEKTATNQELAEKMVLEARRIGMPVFSSIYSERWVPWVEYMGLGAIKIASFELTDVNLIRKAALTGRTIILSTGMATLQEVTDAVRVCDRTNFILLHCVSAYPTYFVQCNLHKIRYLKETFKCPVGFSDHTSGVQAGQLAVGCGANVLEKHLMLAGTPSEDSRFSLTPDQFCAYSNNARRAWEAIQPCPVQEETQSRKLRRSLFVVQDVEQEDYVTIDNVRALRGYGGLPPYNLYNTVGRKFVRRLPAGTPLTEEQLL